VHNSQQVAAGVLSDHKGFLLSPNIKSFSLNETDQSNRESMIVEYLERKFAEMNGTEYKSRLDQAREQIVKLNNQIVIALLNGEDEQSDYIQNRSEKIAALIKQVEELEGLSGIETIKAVA
jgi:hypothetical protein